MERFIRSPHTPKLVRAAALAIVAALAGVGGTAVAAETTDLRTGEIVLAQAEPTLLDRIIIRIRQLIVPDGTVLERDLAVDQDDAKTENGARVARSPDTLRTMTGPASGAADRTDDRDGGGRREADTIGRR